MTSFYTKKDKTEMTENRPPGIFKHFDYSDLFLVKDYINVETYVKRIEKQISDVSQNSHYHKKDTVGVGGVKLTLDIQVEAFPKSFQP